MTSIYTRLGMYFFIIGALISIFDGAFIQDPSVHGIIYIILIFTGIFAGLLNISEDEEHHFLMSAGVFILVIMAFNQIFAAEPVSRTLYSFLQECNRLRRQHGNRRGTQVNTRIWQPELQSEPR
jgi:hypothetical protein